MRDPLGFPGLDFHGDAELSPGLVDLAVNVRPDDGRRAEAEMIRLGAVPIRRDLLAA